MSLYYHRQFRVRGYEVGASARVHDSVFLNYIQQAAFEGSADAGYDTRRYDALGTIWVIRKQTIAYLASLFYDDVVQLTTWVSDVRRVRSHREYELRRAVDGALVAVASADWVYLDVAKQFPHRITPDIISAFQPNGRSALEDAPPLEPKQSLNGRSFVYRHRVKSYELDNLRHVNNANYLNWLDQARLDALSDVGYPPNSEAYAFTELAENISPVRYEIEYLVPAVEGDQVEVRSQAAAAGAGQLTWLHQIYRGPQRLVEATAVVCFKKPDGGALPLPDALLQALVS
jgi:YbgC/YbaW family acyl-CoA thioester hydrolase